MTTPRTPDWAKNVVRRTADASPAWRVWTPKMLLPGGAGVGRVEYFYLFEDALYHAATTPVEFADLRHAWDVPDRPEEDY